MSGTVLGTGQGMDGCGVKIHSPTDQSTKPLPFTRPDARPFPWFLILVPSGPAWHLTYNLLVNRTKDSEAKAVVVWINGFINDNVHPAFLRFTTKRAYCIYMQRTVQANKFKPVKTAVRSELN